MGYFLAVMVHLPLGDFMTRFGANRNFVAIAPTHYFSVVCAIQTIRRHLAHLALLEDAELGGGKRLMQSSFP